MPTSIKTRNGDLITIAYRSYDSTTFKYRWAIDHVYDSLGRYIRFKYYGDPGYTADAANGRPEDALAAVTAPDFAGGSSEREMVRIEYQDITLSYNFSAVASAPSNGSTLTVLKRIYYPGTGRGYLLTDYSTYGMPRRVSSRKDMTGTGGTITDGTEIAYSKYDYTTIDPADPYDRHQVGALNDAPQYTEQSEWWLGKTDAQGNPDSSDSVYEFSRSSGTDMNGFTVDIATSTHPNGLTVVTTTGNDPVNAPDAVGRVVSVEQKDVNTVLFKTTYTYLGTDISSIETQDGASPRIRTDFTYGSYGRLTNVYEFGFAASWQRRTRYTYLDGTEYIDTARLLHLTTLAEVTDNTGAKKAKTVYSYDDYAVKGGMESYGLTAGTYPPNHDASWDEFEIARGNVTGVQTYHELGGGGSSTTRYTKYDIFGNPVEADVACCVVKAFTFGGSNYYSQPLSVRDGNLAGPNLTTSNQYDFNTGLVTQSTNPDGLNTLFQYDNAWRMLTVTSPTGATSTTQFDKDANQNDQLAYSQQSAYTDNGVAKTITAKSWFDGAGRVLRSGTGTGTAPSSFDAVATIYDFMGRVSKQSNPYAGDSSGIGTGLCPAGSPNQMCWTTNTFDKRSRVTEVTLPDGQKIQTAYSDGTPTVTVTDQVGRQRKSEVDGLGRLIKVTEQDPATGTLSWDTTYSYDTLDNLTGVNQGGQTRTFAYDALSRVTSQTTPEGGNETFTYTSFNAVQTRTDARGVITTYGYDVLNRPQSASYNTSGAPGVATTTGVTINYQTTSPGKGQVSSVTDGLGTESYQFDSVGRVLRKTRTIETRSYHTDYQYNTANQLTLMIYPSGKRVQVNRDTKGRLSGVDKVDSGGGTLLSYLSNVGYNTAGQVTGLNLGNGVSETFGYSNDRLQLTSQTASKGTTLMSLNYSYGATGGQSGTGTSVGNSGQLMSMSVTINGQNRDQAFTYDNVGRLVTASGWSAWGRRFAYDRWGNRTGMWNAVAGGSQLQNVTMANTGGFANNKIGDVNGVTNAYDPSGNCTADGAHSYLYDAENRQVSVDAGATSTSGYDPNNRRIKKVAGGVTTHYVWESAQVIAEYNGSTGALISEYVNVGGTMIREQGSAIRYYLSDRLSTRLITDGTGTVVGTMDHLPFGEDPLTGTGESEKHRFTTYERDIESGTDYAVNRQHQNANGRFMQTDKLAGTILDPQTLNRYSYAFNEPIDFFDPDGRVPFAVLVAPGLAGAAIGLLAGAAGNTIAQVLMNRGFTNFSFKSVAIAAGVGAVSGAATAYTGPVGTILVGAGAGGGQYLLTQWLNEQPVDYVNLFASVALGGLSGGLSVVLAPTKGALQFGWNPAGFSKTYAAQLNAQSRVNKTIGTQNLARSAGVSTLSNLSPSKPSDGSGVGGRPEDPLTNDQLLSRPLPAIPYGGSFWGFGDGSFGASGGGAQNIGEIAVVDVNSGMIQWITPILSPVFTPLPAPQFTFPF